MAVSTLRGSLSSTSTPEGIENRYIEPGLPIASTVVDRVKNSQVYKDTYNHGTVLNIDLNDGVLRALKAYVSGYSAKCTYYRRRTPNSNLMTGDVGNGDPDHIHDTYDRINDFELKFSQAMQFAHMSEENKSQVNGSATTYPGFVPYVGDFFLYTISNDRVGKFDIVGCTRLSIASQTCYTVELELTGFVSTEDIEAYEARVADVFFFDVHTFTGSKGVLLQTNEVVLKNDAEMLISQLERAYVESFYNRLDYDSFIRPDGVYDPYLVHFITKLLSFELLNRRPKQLLRDLRDYWRSYWYFIENPEDGYRNRTYGKYGIYKYVRSALNTDITTLLNRNYVKLVPDNTTSVILHDYISEGIGTIVEPQTDFDNMVRLYIEQKKIDPTLLLQLSQDYHELSPIEQFYKVPVYLYFLRTLLHMINNGIVTAGTTPAADYVPTRYEFTQSNLSEGNILVISMVNTVLGVLDNNGVQHLFESGEIVYNAGLIHVNFSGLMDRLEIEELIDTWTLVLTGVV